MEALRPIRAAREALEAQFLKSSKSPYPHNWSIGGSLAVAVSLAEEISTETQVTASRTHTALRFRRILRVSDKSQGSQHSALSAAVQSQFAALRPVVHRFRRTKGVSWSKLIIHKEEKLGAYVYALEWSRQKRFYEDSG
ncbi:hypothetical protein DM860_002921 [Cuscuta australis]|uniref:Uncharacterized protein n=1 Tax=Cuscuta australis TaxID=267555 RepID=A0A328D4L0_9ASTE|nr:hypothetical protein DM860_002921 [Cuscuta australis]